MFKTSTGGTAEAVPCSQWSNPNKTGGHPTTKSVKFLRDRPSVTSPAECVTSAVRSDDKPDLMISDVNLKNGKFWLQTRNGAYKRVNGGFGNLAILQESLEHGSEGESEPYHHGDEVLSEHISEKENRRETSRDNHVIRQLVVSNDFRYSGGSRSAGAGRTISTMPTIEGSPTSQCDHESEKLSSCGSETETSSSGEFKVFNVSGTYFFVEMCIFSLYPDTLLGSETLADYYRSHRDEYFIEHNKHIFPAILRFYTHEEEIVCPPCLPKETFEDCLDFYGLLPYYRGEKSVINPIKTELDEPTNFKERILYTLQYPYFSFSAKVYALFDIMIIVLSTITLVLESIPELVKINSFNTVAQIVEAFVNIYFTVQALVLLAVFPTFKEYIKNVLHWIDILSILPFYLGLVAGPFLSQVGGFRVLRLIRLLRVMKLFKHSRGSQSMMTFLFASLPEIMLLLLMWGIGVLLFGPLIFFIEHDHGGFQSAFSGMWFCVVTIGTVGYGDITPVTNLGKFVSAFYTILNLTIMTIPISIIITKFSRTMKSGKK